VLEIGTACQQAIGTAGDLALAMMTSRARDRHRLPAGDRHRR
jgi:hypothetical protein